MSNGSLLGDLKDRQGLLSVCRWRGQWNRLGNGGLLGGLGDLLVHRNMWAHVWLRFVRLRRRKTWAGLKLDVISIAVTRAAVNRLYGYEELEKGGKGNKNPYLLDNRRGYSW